MVDPRVVADLARGHPPGARADDHRVQPAPSSAGPWRYRARRQASRPGPGAPLVSKGPTWRVDGPGSWSRPRALAAGRCRRLSLLHGPGCSVNSARRPRPRNLLGAERGAAPGPRSSRACPESICSNRPHPGPGLAQPPSHIAPVDGLVPLLSRPQSASVLPSGLIQTIEHARAAHCFAGHQGPDGGALPDPGGPAAHGRGGARGLRLSWWTAPSSPARTGAGAAICGRSSTGARG